MGDAELAQGQHTQPGGTETLRNSMSFPLHGQSVINLPHEVARILL